MRAAGEQKNHANAEKRYGLDSLKDANGNLFHKVAIESEIAEWILHHPVGELLHIIEAVSKKLLFALNHPSEQNPHQTVLQSLLSVSPCEHYFLQLLSSHSPEIGKLSDKYQGMRLDQAILALLYSQVDQENVLMHFKVAQVMSYLLYFLCYSNEGVSIGQNRQAAVNMLDRLSHEHEPASNEERYQALMQRYHPDVTEMEGIRTRREHPGERLTSVKGIYARDYLNNKGDQLGILPPHVRGGDIWMIQRDKTSSDFLKEAEKHGLPLVAGASGSAARWLALLNTIDFDDAHIIDEKPLYKTYILAYMVACGHHSMHEVAHIFNKEKSEYVIGDMYSLIPEAVLSHARLNALLNQYATISRKK